MTAPHSPQWYRHPWVWALIAIPGSSVVVGIVMILLAASGPTDLVRDDYYKAGLAINQEFDAEERARALGADLEVIDRGAAGLLVRVETANADEDAFEDMRLRAELQHPTLAERDRFFELESVAAGRWAATIDRFEGVRMLRIEAPSGGWVLKREYRGAADGSVTIER